MSKYKYDVTQIKVRLKELRCSKKLTQAKFAEGINIGTGTSRTTVTTWEKTSNGNKTLPDIQTLIDICNFFDCDLDYLFGKSDIESQDHHTISNVLHISKESINTLRNNKEYGLLLNKIIGKESFGEISNRVHQLALNRALDDVITTCLNRKLEKKVESIFTEYYFSDFPFNMSQKNYCEYIKNSIPYSEDFNPEKFIEDNFLEDGRNVIKNKSDNFSSLSKSEKYEIVMSSIADITYDYYISKNLAELSKQKLDMMLSKLLQDVIEEEVEEIKAKLINNIH